MGQFNKQVTSARSAGSAACILLLLATVSTSSARRIDSAAEASSSRFSCPESSSITPCTCEITGLDVAVDCSAAPSYDFLVDLFSQNVFQTTNMHTFRMTGNNNVQAIRRNLFGTYTFKNVVISSNPSLTEVAVDAFSGCEAVLEHLDLNGNALTSLGLLYNLAGFTKLDYLDMGNNQISGAVTAFTCPPALLQLWLHNNLLTVIDPMAFATCATVRYLGVGGNAFTSFGADAFAGLAVVEIIAANLCDSLSVIQTGAFPLVSEALTEVRLNGNPQLRTVQPNAIRGQPCSAKIQMKKCDLTTLESAAFQPMLEEFTLQGCGGYLDVTGCPIQCTCDMAWLLTDPGLKIHVKGTCASDGVEIVNQPEDPWITGCR